MNIDYESVSNLSQIAYIKEIINCGGLKDGFRELIIKNEGLSVNILISRGFDIGDLSYKGDNISYINKNGLVSPYMANSNGFPYCRSFSGGFLVTCGLDNIGEPTGDTLQHGIINCIPVEIIRKEIVLENNKPIIYLQAEIRQSQIFKENLKLIRKIRISCDEIIITDTIKNEGYNIEPIYQLYHFNFGYPFLTDSTTININSESVRGREEYSQGKLNDFNKFSLPYAKFREEVFYHSVLENMTCARVTSKNLDFSVEIKYDNKNLKHLIEWKNPLSGDYALGIEPSTTLFEPKVPLELKVNEEISNSITIKIQDNVG